MAVSKPLSVIDIYESTAANWIQSTISVPQMIAIVRKRLYISKHKLLTLAYRLGLSDPDLDDIKARFTEENTESMVVEMLNKFSRIEQDLVVFREMLITALQLCDYPDIVITLLYCDVRLDPQECYRVIHRNKEFMQMLADSAEFRGRLDDIYLSLSLALVIDIFNSSQRAAAICSRYLTDFRDGIFFTNILQGDIESLRYLFVPVLLPLPNPVRYRLSHSVADQVACDPSVHFVLIYYTFNQEASENECSLADSLNSGDFPKEYADIIKECLEYACQYLELAMGRRYTTPLTPKIKLTSQCCDNDENCGVYLFISVVAVLFGVTSEIKDPDRTIVKEARTFMFNLVQHAINFDRDLMNDLNDQYPTQDNMKQKYQLAKETLINEGHRLVDKIRDSIDQQRRAKALTVSEVTISSESIGLERGLSVITVEDRSDEN